MKSSYKKKGMKQLFKLNYKFYTNVIQVETTHLNYTFKKKVVRVTEDSAETLIFDKNLADGQIQATTVQSHYLEKYGMSLR